MINPVAGNGKQAYLALLIKQHIDSNSFDFQIMLTREKGELIEISKRAANEGLDALIVAGGDGIVNEAGQGLLDSRTALGIIPAGSGNGLARHLQIPMNSRKALEVINRFNITSIDAGTLKRHSFFLHFGSRF